MPPPIPPPPEALAASGTLASARAEVRRKARLNLVVDMPIPFITGWGTRFQIRRRGRALEHDSFRWNPVKAAVML